MDANWRVVKRALEVLFIFHSMGVAMIFFLGGTLFENFQKISLENCEKCIILAYFSKKLTNHALIFRAFGRKTQFAENF